MHDGKFKSNHSSLHFLSYVSDAWGARSSHRIPDIQELINFIPPLPSRWSQLQKRQRGMNLLQPPFLSPWATGKEEIGKIWSETETRKKEREAEKSF